MPLKATIGQILINQALPKSLRNYGRVLDKKGIETLFNTIAKEHPEEYRDVSKKLSDIGRYASTYAGGNSITLQSITKAKAAKKIQEELRTQIHAILDNDHLTDKERNEQLIKVTGSRMQEQIDAVYKESLDEKNPLAHQILSGARGNERNLNSIRGGDYLYSDHKDNVIPLPVLSSYSEGLRPSEYWATTYGGRRGVLATKFAVADAGYLGKQLNQAGHRLLIVGNDRTPDLDEDGNPMPTTVRGLPVDTEDPDNEGALLAHDMGGYKRNTLLTPKVLNNIKQKGVKRILVRSPIVGGSPEGGLYAYDVGVREQGRLPGVGEIPGMSAAQSLGEPLAQGTLSAKHSGGIAGGEKTLGGFAGINQLVQAPEVFKFGAAHSTQDGKVESIEPGPAGGNYVRVNGKNHFVNQGFNVLVKKGDEIEAGDVLSEGSPNPATVIQHKGVGEGAKYWVKAFQDAMKRAGIKANRRNVELTARALINHVRLTEEHDDFVPDDVVHYSTLESRWQPREGFETVRRDRALGKYLERPYLHYSIGTKVRPSVLRDLKEFGIEDVDVHDRPPPFEPEMIRGMANLQHDPEWLPRLYGSGQKKSLLSGVHRNNVTDEKGTSFVPSLVRGVDFGRSGLVRQPLPGLKPPEEGTPFPSMQKNSADYGPSPNPVPKPSFSQTPKTVKAPSSENTQSQTPALNSNISATPGGGQTSYDPRIQELDQRTMDKSQTPANPGAAYHGGFTGNATPTQFAPEQFAGVDSTVGLAGALNPEALAVLTGQQNYARQQYQQQQRQQQMMLGGFPGLQGNGGASGEEDSFGYGMNPEQQAAAGQGRDFWRADNPLAWGAGLGGAYGAGRLTYGMANRFAPSMVGNASNYSRLGRGLAGNAVTRNLLMLNKPGTGLPTTPTSTAGKAMSSVGKAFRALPTGLALYDAGETLLPALQGDWNTVNQKSQGALNELEKNPLLYGLLNTVSPVKNVQAITAGLGKLDTLTGDIGRINKDIRDSSSRIKRMENQGSLLKERALGKQRIETKSQENEKFWEKHAPIQKRWLADRMSGKYTQGPWTDPDTGEVFSYPTQTLDPQGIYKEMQPPTGLLKQPPTVQSSPTITRSSTEATPNPTLQNLMMSRSPESSRFEN